MSSSVASTIIVLKERLQKILDNQDTINNDDIVESVKDCLQRLDEVDMNFGLLMDTEISKTVLKFKSHAIIGATAKALNKKWKRIYRQGVQQQQQQQNGPPECTGLAAKALAKFRKRVKELEQFNQKKPDMVAFKELRNTWTPSRSHGELEGVPIGLHLSGRGEAAILGIHTNILSGIDAIKDQACFAVCLSGGYKDDKDRAADGTVIYTGSGGQDKHKQDKDQVENTANASLITSMASRDPIRLLRGTKIKGKPEYFYEGLYRCTDYTYENSFDGPYKVYRFKLVPIPGKSTHSITVNQAGSSSLSTKSGSRGRIVAHASQRQQVESQRDRDVERQRRDATRS